MGGYFDRRAARDSLDTYSRIAARQVALWTAPPDPMTQEYRDAAEDSERLVYDYLVNSSGGSLSGASLSGEGSLSVASLDAVKRIIRESMGEFYTGGAGAGGAGSGGLSAVRIV